MWRVGCEAAWSGFYAQEIISSSTTWHSTLFNDETFLLVATTSRREQGQGRDSRLRNLVFLWVSKSPEKIGVIMGKLLSAAVVGR